jgi:hypothetical protein
MSGIVQWREFVPDCTAECKEQFAYLLTEYGLQELDADDIFYRCCQRYVGYLKLIHHKVKKYFTEAWAINGVTEQFSKKEAKWLVPIIQNRTKNPEGKYDLESMQEILLWVGLRYNFWLSQQL